jgi:putative hydrolase of the HAD superfamily
LVVLVPLLLLDLDDTLVDRAAAFRSWAVSFMAEAGGSTEDAEWLVSIDADGWAEREYVAHQLRDRLDLDQRTEDLVDAMLRGVVEEATTTEATREALRAASSLGWTPVVVTNGSVARQEAKLRRTGLDRLVAGWIVSEAVSVRKPDPRVFAIAAEGFGESLAGAWMVGDNAWADIGGAHASGISSVWLSRGRPWPDVAYAPTLVTDDFPAAMHALAPITGP